MLTVLGSLSFLDLLFGSESGNDADYYDAYARGFADFATSFWPILLRKLYDMGLYSREGITAFQLLLGVWLIPPLIGVLSVPKGLDSHFRRKALWFSAALLSLYPTLYVFTFDIYRDVTMMTIFLVALIIAWKLLESSKVNTQVLYTVPLILVIWLLYLFRPYLGFSFTVSLGLALVLAKLRFDKQTIFVLFLIYIAALMLAYQETTLLHPLLEYRGESGFDKGGSTFGLGLLGRSPLEFVLVFVLSFLFQVFGLYLHSFKALILFLFESLPFLFFTVQLLGRYKLPDTHTKFLLIFSVIYATFFVLGNDNLGTAARLRLFVYVAIFIAWARSTFKELGNQRPGGQL